MNTADLPSAQVPTIVVGVSDAPPSPSSDDLRFAATEARLRGGRLRAVHGCASWSPAGYVTQERVHHGRHVLDAAAEVLRGLAGGDVEVTTVNSQELVTDALLGQAGSAALVVLRRRDDDRARVTGGSTISTVAARADCPVAVVGPRSAFPFPAFLHGSSTSSGSGGPGPGGGGEVVVAVDELEDTVALVRLAAATASGRSVPLVLAHAWQPLPLAVHGGLRTIAQASVPLRTAGRSGTHRLADALVMLAGEFPDVDVRQHSTRGGAVEVLVDFSGRAGLLVLGRGAGHPLGLAGLGPVTRALLTRARCPLLIGAPGHMSHPRDAAALVRTGPTGVGS